MPLVTPLPPPLPPPEQSRLSPAGSLCLFRNIIPLIAGRQEKALGAGAAVLRGGASSAGAPAPLRLQAPLYGCPAAALRSPGAPRAALRHRAAYRFLLLLLLLLILFFPPSSLHFPPFLRLRDPAQSSLRETEYSPEERSYRGAAALGAALPLPGRCS